MCSACADSDSDGVRRSEVAVLETVEPDSTGDHTGSRCDHVSGGQRRAASCAVLLSIGAVKIVALATSGTPARGVGPMQAKVYPTVTARLMTSPGCA